MKPLHEQGGSAFPVREARTMHGEVYVDAELGMTLRDYFAAKAMHAELNTAGMLVGPAEALAEEAEKSGRTIEAQIAFNAYLLADAMLKERAT